MAESFVPSDLCEELVCCVICYEPFSGERVPKALPCLHTFCVGCLKSSIIAYQKNVLKLKRATASGDFPCPVCKAVTPVPENGMSGFRNDFRIQKISELLEKTRNLPLLPSPYERSPNPSPNPSPTHRPSSPIQSAHDKPCEICKFFSKDIMADLYCMQCSKLLCKSCADKHKSTPIAKDHTLVEAAEVLPSDNQCETHKGESLLFFCRNCSKSLCATCTFTDEHTNHDVVKLDDEKEKVTTKLSEMLALCRQRSPGIKEILAEHDRYEKRLNVKEKAAQKAIVMHTVAAINKLRKEQTRMENELDNMCRAKYQELQGGRQQLNKYLTEAGEYCDLVDTLLKNGKDVQIVSGHTDMQTKLQTLSVFKSKGLPDEGMFVDLGKYDTMAEQYALEMKQNKGENTSEMSIIAEIRSVASQMKLISVGRADLKVELVRVVGCKGDKDGEFNFPSGVAILPNGDFAITDLHNGRVQIFDREGRFRRKFGHEGFKPCGIAITREGHIAVTDTKSHVNCIKIFTADGIRRGALGKGLFDYPFSVDVDSKGRFIVSDPAKNQIVILKSDGALETRFETKTKFAFYVSVNYKDEVVVSDWYNHCVRIFDQTGLLLRKIGTRGTEEGQLMIPLGLCTDSRGTIMVLDCKCQRISMFGYDGRFIKHLLTSKKEGLEFSRAIALSKDGRLVITHGDNKRDIPNEVRIYQI